MIKAKIGDLAEVTKLAGFEYSKNFEYLDDGEIIALRGLNVKNGNLDLKNVKKISKSVSEKLPRSKLFKGDILLTYTGTIGEVAIIEEDNKYHLAPNVSLVRAKNIDPYFLYSLMRTNYFKNSLKKFSVGSTQKTIPMKNIRQIEIFYFEESVEYITNFMKQIDKKVKINEKINETLDEISKSLFKSWFMDFDPVKAKAEGRPTGLSEEISNLFPDSFEESELGKIPKGWTVEKIGTYFDVLLGGTPSRKKEEYWNGDIPWINSGEINNFRVMSHSELITKSGLENSSTKLMPKRSTLIAITGATLGQVSLNEIDVCGNQSVIGISPSPSVFPEYVYLWINFTIKKLISLQTGGAQQHINTGNVKDHLILLPEENICNYLKTLFKSVFDMISTNLLETQTLISLRDTLLPKLISGDLKVPEVENLIDEVSI